MKKLTRRQALRMLGSGALLGFSGVAFADVEARMTEIVKREIRLPKWNAGPVRVALIADLHTTHPVARDRALEAIQSLVALKPDVFLISGDLLESSADFCLRYLRAALAPISDSRIPAFGVMGNHDYWCVKPDHVWKTATDAGVRMLRNESVDLGGFAVAGLDDALCGDCRPGDLSEGDLPKSVIGLLHEPDYVDLAPSAFSIQLSGHSHGGQICLPFGVPVKTPIGARRYVKGLYELESTPLYVTRGLGTTGVNLRLFCRPEATLLTLRSA